MGVKLCKKCRKKKGACKCGRPTVMSREVIDKLEQAFSLDCTDSEACLYAGISTTALYDYQVKQPEFTERKKLLKETLVMKSRANIVKAIDNMDISTSKWYLERKNKDEFGRRVEVPNIPDQPFQIIINRPD